MAPRKPLHNHPPPRQPTARPAPGVFWPPRESGGAKPSGAKPSGTASDGTSAGGGGASQRPSSARPAARPAPKRLPVAKRQARSELRAVREQLDGLAYHDQGGDVHFVGQRHLMQGVGGVDLREAWAATTRMDQLASARDAHMSELEDAHAHAADVFSGAKQQLAQAAARLAMERNAPVRGFARGGSPHRASPARAGSPKQAAAAALAAGAVERAIDLVLQDAKAALAAAGGEVRPDDVAASRARATGSRVRAAEAAAKHAAEQAREERRRQQLQQEEPQQEPMHELEDWLARGPSSPLAPGAVGAAVDARSASPYASKKPAAAAAPVTRRVSLVERQAAAKPQSARSGRHAGRSPGRTVRSARHSITTSGAGDARGMTTSAAGARGGPAAAARRHQSAEQRKPRVSIGGDVASAVVWGSVRRHMSAVHTHHRRAASAAVRKCPAAARKLLADVLYKCPAVHPPSRSINGGGGHGPGDEATQQRSAQLTHPHEGRRIARAEFRSACTAITPRHASLGHNLTASVVDTLSEWFRCDDDPAAIALLPLAAACDLPEPPPPPPLPLAAGASPYRPTSAMKSSSNSPEHKQAAARSPQKRRASSLPRSRPYSTELSRHRARNARDRGSSARRAATPPARRPPHAQQERDDAWEREHERATAVTQPLFSCPSPTKTSPIHDGNESAPAPAPGPSYDDPGQWGLDAHQEHHGGVHGGTSSPVGQPTSPRSIGAYRPETAPQAFGTHIPPEKMGAWRSSPEPSPPQFDPLFSGDRSQPWSPERLAEGEDWCSPLIEQRVADQINAAAMEATTSAASAVAAASAAASASTNPGYAPKVGTPVAVAVPVPSTPQRTPAQRRPSDPSAGAPQTLTFQTPAHRSTVASTAKETTPGRRAAKSLGDIASPSLGSKPKSYNSVRSPVLQLRMMLATPEASSSMMRACADCDEADRVHDGRAFEREDKQPRRPDGMIRLDEWRQLLLAGRATEVGDFGAVQLTDAPISGAAGFAKLTLAQVNILESIAVRGGTVRTARIGREMVEVIDYMRFAKSFGLLPQ